MPIPAGSGPVAAPTSGPLVYDPVLSRVRLSLSGLADGVPVRVERSTDQVRWTAVRGGSALLSSAGVARLDDYEFAADAANHYRVIGPLAWDTFTRTVAAGWDTSDSGHGWTTGGGVSTDRSVTGTKGRHTLGSVGVERISKLETVSAADVDITITGVTISAAPTGASAEWGVKSSWDQVANSYNEVRVFWTTGGTVTVNLRQRVAGVDTVTSGFPVVAGLSSADALSVRYQVSGSVIRVKVWATAGSEPVDWTLTETAPGVLAANIPVVRSMLGAGNTNTLPVLVEYDSFVITAPEAVIYTGSIAPVLERVWLKSIARPFLNRQVTVVDYSDVERPSRAGIFDVVGRSLPVSVNDVRGSRRWALEVLTGTADDSEDLDLLLASGDVLFVQAPAGTGVPGGYVLVGDTRQRRTSRLGARRVFELPCTEVAAPGPDVIGSTVTCQTVLNTYPTCTAVLAAHDTCLSLMELIGDPTDVIVP